MPHKIVKRTFKIVGIALVSILAALVILMLYFNSKPGQKTLGNLVFNQLSAKIGTPITGKLSFSIPDWVTIDNLLVLDQKADTLIYSQKAHLDIALFQLLKNELNIEQVELENTLVNLNKKDSVFNFDYIVEAFSSKNTDTTSAGLKINLNGIKLSKLKLNYDAQEQWFKVDLGMLKSGFKTLDLDKGIYVLKDSEISGLTVNGSLGESTTDSSSADTTSTLPDIRFSKLLADNLNWDIDLGNQVITGKNAKLRFNAKEVNLPKMLFEIEELGTSFDQVTYRDKDAKSINNGEINFKDLAFENFRLSTKNLSYKEDSFEGEINELKFKEKSGLELVNANALASLKDNLVSLTNLNISTPASSLKGNAELAINDTDFAKSKFEANIIGLKVVPKEALFFASSLRENTTFQKIINDTFTASGLISGTLEEINLERVNITAPSETKLAINGKIYNKNTLGLDLKISNFFTTKKDLQRVIGTLPENIDLPNRLHLNGNLKGTLEDLAAELFLNSDQGGARLAGTLKNLSKTPNYKGTFTLEDYNVGAFIKNPEVGQITGVVVFDGQSFDKPNVNVDASIAEASFRKEVYKNIKLNGNLKDNILTANGSLKDKRASLDLDAIIDLNGEAITLTGKTQIQNLNLKTLGLTDEEIFLQGDFDIHKLVADKKNPFIDFKGNNIIVIKDNEKYPVGKLDVLTEYGKDEKRLDLTANFLKLSLSGNFEYDKLQGILLTEVNKYFRLPDFTPLTDSTDFYFDINGTISYDPVFTAFVPAIKTFETISIQSSLKSDGPTPFVGHIEVPYLLYDSLKVVRTVFDFTGNGTTLAYDLTSDQVSNPSFRVRKAEMEGKLKENIASFALSVKDSTDEKIHSLAGILESDGKKVRVSFDESGTMIFYENWGGNPYGYIDYSPEGLSVNNVVFSSGEQVLRLNSESSEPNSPIDVFTEKLDLNFFSKAILQDSSMVAGFLDLDLRLSNFIGDKGLEFTGNASIKDFLFSGVELGNFSGTAESTTRDKITIAAVLGGKQTDVDITGAYYSKRDDALDFKVDIGSLEIKALEPFLEGIAYDLNGKIKGLVTVKGPTSKPIIDGQVDFVDARFRVQETGAELKMDKQVLAIKNSKINFDQVVIKDSKNEEMKVNGAIDLSKLPDITYNLDLTSTNFLIASSERGQSKLFYGTAYLGSKLNLKGKNGVFKVTGQITTKEGTDLVLLLPDESVGADLNSVVTFVDFDNPDAPLIKNDIKTLSLANALNVNVFLDEKSKVGILMNPITGDLLSARGDAQLNVGFDNAGDLFIVGNLDIKEGSYEMTYQAIKKHFEISKISNSKISFTGDPLKGVMDITAEYKVPGKKDVVKYPDVDKDLKAEGVSINRELVDLRVDLVLKGEVLNPDIDFLIVASKKDISSTALSAILKKKGFTFMDEDGKVESAESSAVTSANKESLTQNAIMLLIAGNFTASQMIENFTSSSGSGYEDLARRNASEIISSQLEKYASGLIKGVDLDVGVQSSGGFSESGSDRSTNLNLGLSKRLANDRLIVSVGKNFELENKDRQSDEVFDNLEANWLITPDGRYRLKVFRKNQNQSAIEGSVIETGFGFSIGIDYDTWKELLNRKK